MNGFWTHLRHLWRTMLARPRTAASVALAFAILGLGVWSCQTTPAARAPLHLGDSVKSSVEPEVRIRIRSALQTVKLEGPKSMKIQRTGEPARIVEGPLNFAVMASGVRMTDGTGISGVLDGFNPIEVTSLGEVSPPPRIHVESSYYPGHLRIYPRGAASMAEDSATAAPGLSRMEIIALMPIEEYLIGVVAAELYPDWKSPGVFEVQAVCARTYALHERQRSIEKGQEWDLESTEEDQAYKGGTVKPEALKAVRETRGVVMTWNGKLLRAYYSSTCGGRVASAADVWPTGPGYEFNLAGPIQAHHREALCQASPKYRWEVTRDRTTFSKQLREWGKAKNHAIAGLGLFKSMSVEKVNADERPSKYTVVDGAGKTYSITAEFMRNACNFKGAGLPALANNQLVRSGDVEIEVKGTNVVIRGRGFGHGVGMCQFCAKAMADRGDSWQVMLARFYPGAKVERAF